MSTALVDGGKVTISEFLRMYGESKLSLIESLKVYRRNGLVDSVQTVVFDRLQCNAFTSWLKDVIVCFEGGREDEVRDALDADGDIIHEITGSIMNWHGYHSCDMSALYDLLLDHGYDFINAHNPDFRWTSLDWMDFRDTLRRMGMRASMRNKLLEKAKNDKTVVTWSKQ